MKFIIKTEMSVFKEAFKIILIILLLMFVGTIIAGITFEMSYFLGRFVLIFWSAISFIITIFYIILAVLDNIKIEKTLDETEETKILKAILKELKASNKANEFKIIDTDDNLKNKLEEEHSERL